MYDIIKAQFDSKKVLTSSKYYNLVKREHWPKFYWDLHPLVQEYFHELNPYFLFNLYHPEFFRFAKVFTARDGYLPFASFIMNFYTQFAKLEFGNFLIHPDLAPLVPPHLAHHFGVWQRVQKKQVSIEQARKVILFGFVSDQYLGDLDNLVERMLPLKSASPNAEISLYLPIRKNVFETNGKESLAIHLVMNSIKDVLPGRKLKILSSENFFDLTDFKDTYLFDLAFDNMYVSDTYVHYFVQSRGATVNNGTLKEAPKDSLFSLDLSLHHELHVCPLPQEKNFFNELVFYKKQNPTVKDFTFDMNLQGILREMLKKDS